MCRQRNSSRPSEEQYEHATLDNLIARYEEPSSMARWDSPLFTIPWDESMPFDDIQKALTEGNVKPPNAGTLSVSMICFSLGRLLTRVTGRQGTNKCAAYSRTDIVADSVSAHVASFDRAGREYRCDSPFSSEAGGMLAFPCPYDG